MLHANDPAVREYLLQGNFGLEKESLRVTGDGYLAHTPHPFPEDDPNIVRDFCENQTEINTGVHPTADGAVSELREHYERIQRTLMELPVREYLWPFSNPPYIRGEDDVPVACFEGGRSFKTAYRYYLSDRYGRYTMCFSGIHFNFSFGEDLLEQDFRVSGMADRREYRDQFYLELAEKAAQYGWILTAVTAASPMLDSSFVEKGKTGGDCFTGMASVRCGPTGYWNFFAPVFDYRDIRSYADSIQRYVDDGLLAAPSELYYPVRLKPRGENDLTTLRENGVNHIELRMFDLNPLDPAGVRVEDVRFAQLLLVFLASIPRRDFPESAQVQAVQNFKNAASYDLKTVKIVPASGAVCSVADAARDVLYEMRRFYRDFPEDVQAVLQFETDKFRDPENRYAWILRREFADGYVTKGLELARKRQEELRV